MTWSERILFKFPFLSFLCDSIESNNTLDAVAKLAKRYKCVLTNSHAWPKFSDPIPMFINSANSNIHNPILSGSYMDAVKQ